MAQVLTLVSLEDLEVLKKEHKRRTVFWHIGRVREVQSPAAGPSLVTRFHESENNFMQVLTDSQQVDVSVAFTDKKGNPTAVESPVWSVSDSALLSVEQDASDPLKAVVKAVGPLGSGQVNLTVDPKVGPDTGSLVATLDVQVVAGDAVSGTFTTGTPTEQP